MVGLFWFGSSVSSGDEEWVKCNNNELFFRISSCLTSGFEGIDAGASICLSVVMFNNIFVAYAHTLLMCVKNDSIEWFNA